MYAQRQVRDSLFDVAGRVAELLAAGRFEEVAALSGNGGLSALDVRNAVREIPGTLVPLPPDSKSLLDVVQIGDADSRAWSVIQPLFTAEEGRSDLSLLLTVVANADGSFIVQVDDIHVL